ncbi:MAG: nucleoporin [Rhodospirillales bacterium]|nr:nucleoporin [Rhodospirillales bacterium]
MVRLTVLLAFVAALFVSTQAVAVPAEFKKELNEINKVIRNATTQVVYKKKYDGMSEELDRATQSLKDLAAKAGVSESDSDIKRALKRIADTRKKLNKALAKQGKTPGAVKSKSGFGAPKKTTKTPGAVASKSGFGAPKASTKTPGAVKSKSGFGAPKAATKTPGAVTPKGGSMKPKGAAPAQTAAAPAEDWSSQNAVFDKYKTRIVDLNGLVKKMARTEDEAEFLELAKSGIPMFEQSRKVIAAIHEGIPEIRDFQEVNAEAQKINLRYLVSDLESNLIDRAEHRIKMAASGLLNEADSELYSMKGQKRPDFAANSMGRIKEKFAILDAIAPGDAKVAEEKARIMPEAEKRYQAAMANVAKTKMPKEKFDGDDADAIRADIAKLYSAKYADGKVKRVVITSESWKEQAVAEVNNNSEIVAGYYKYLYAQVAVKKAKGCLVYAMGFRKGWTGEGEDYGPLEIRSVGSNYPILEENIGK